MALMASVALIASGIIFISAFGGGQAVSCSEQVKTVSNTRSVLTEFDVPISGENTMENSRPIVWVESRFQATRGGIPQRLELRARAWDAEEGWLGKDAFSWHSSLEPTITSDHQFINYFQGDESPDGVSAIKVFLDFNSTACHSVYVFATDSTGLSGVAEMIIGGKLPPSIEQIAVDDIVSISLSRKEYFDVAGNDLIKSANMRSLRIVEYPKLGNAGVEGTETEGRRYLYLWYESENVGVDSLEYEICYHGSICDTATVHIFSGLTDCTIRGSEGNDAITGSAGDEILCGLGGDDIILSGLGDDIIYGGTGNDRIVSGPGEDTIYGEAGDDIIYGGAGNDKIASGPGEDIIYGGAGQDNVGTINETNISQRKDMVYQDFIDISSASEGLSPQEQVYIDQIILECEFRFSTTQVLNNCGEFASNLCLSRIALGLSRQENIDESRMVIVDFLCQAADLAEKSTFANVLSTRYGQFYNDFGHSSRVFDQFHDSLERDVQELSEFLEENAATLSEETLHKLNQLLETIIAYAEYFFRSFPLSYHDDVID